MPRLLALLVVLLSLPAPAQAQPKARPVLFCFWNVENFFDDQRNPRLEKDDRLFDDYFSKNPKVLQLKLQRLTQVLLGRPMNGGHGPDVIALAEVESLRSVQLLQAELNKKLPNKALHYPHVAYLDPGGGRPIATAVISRLPFVGKPVLLSAQRRILKVTVELDKKPLTIVASHWTARVSDTTGAKRTTYAEIIHRDFAAAYRKDRNVDYLVCGDFNDTPDDRSVTRGLQATGDVKKVLNTREPLFYNPFADLARAGKGTHFFRGKAFVFDQVVVSPGLLDGQGWRYRNKSAAIVPEIAFRGQPDRFGPPDDRRKVKHSGASDHFPVVIELTVNK